MNDQGENIDKATPSTPVEILGINGAAKAGDDFVVLKNEKEAKAISQREFNEVERGKKLTYICK